MAAVTVTKPDKAFKAELGPFEIEVVRVESPSDGDTYASKLVNPSAALLFPIADASGSVDCSTAISGKTVTLHDPVAGVNHFLVVFGLHF